MYRVQLSQNDANDQPVKAMIDDAEKQLPEAGWEIRSRDNASPQLERNIERLTQFLDAGRPRPPCLSAVSVSPTPCARISSAAASYRHREVAWRHRHDAQLVIYLVQVMVIAAIGTAD